MSRNGIARSLKLVVAVYLSMIAVAEDTSQSGTLTDEDYIVVSTVLGNLFDNGRAKNIAMLEITSSLPSTIADTTQMRAKTPLEPISDEAENNLRVRNRNQAKIDVGKIRTSFQILPLDNEETQELMRHNDSWQSFHRRYPLVANVIRVSLPGFNHEHDRALLYIGASCGPLCGGITLFTLRKDKGEWSVVRSINISQS